MEQTTDAMTCALCNQPINTGQLYIQARRATDNYSTNPAHWTIPADLFIAVHAQQPCPIQIPGPTDQRSSR